MYLIFRSIKQEICRYVKAVFLAWSLISRYGHWATYLFLDTIPSLTWGTEEWDLPLQNKCLLLFHEYNITLYK